MSRKRKPELPPNLPQYAFDYTEEQKELIAEYLSFKPVKELRKRQNLFAQQRKLVLNWPSDRPNRELHIEDLGIRFDIESRAIYIRATRGCKT